METTAVQQDRYEIVWNAVAALFTVVKNGAALVDSAGYARLFKTRNAARKRIARERSGNFHK